MERALTILNAHLPSIISEMIDQIGNTTLNTYSIISTDQLSGMVTTVMNALVRDLNEGTNEYFVSYWRAIADARARDGGQISDILAAIVIGEQTMNKYVLADLGDDHAARAWWFQQLYTRLHAGSVALSEAFISAHELIIREQAMRIRELSTPLIPVHTGVLVLPLVGAIDSYRAGQIMDGLLEGISSQQAEVVIMDITGVPVVDTGVGNYLIQAARAAQLLGAQIILVGISAEVAQTIVQLGMDLSGIATMANLQAGIAHAFRLLGLEIRPIQRRSKP